jgi:hypothetical protein
MPRSSHVIARLVVDRPQKAWNVGVSVPQWLRTIANGVELHPDHYGIGAVRWGYFGPGNIDRRVAKLRIGAVGALSDKSRARIAKWLRSRATWIEKHGAHHDRRWFTQEFSL